MIPIDIFELEGFNFRLILRDTGKRFRAFLTLTTRRVGARKRRYGRVRRGKRISNLTFYRLDNYNIRSNLRRNSVCRSFKRKFTYIRNCFIDGLTRGFA